jgi:Protein of unknown function (DUF3306)
MQEHIHTGRIARLSDVAREFIARYSEGDEVPVRGLYEPRPSTAAANAPWVARFRIRAGHLAKEDPTAASRGTKPQPPKKIHEERDRATTPRDPRAALLLALSVLFFLTGGVIVEAQELLGAIRSFQSRDATSPEPQGIEKPKQLAATQSPFDTASLPPIPTISAGSDIRPFLSAGVPADLTRAALRRAWSVDATIRDFIGLSENSWDFNAGDGASAFHPEGSPD